MQIQNSLIQADCLAKVKTAVPRLSSHPLLSQLRGAVKYPRLVHAEQICILNKSQSAEQPKVK